MERTLMKDLVAWKNNPDRKPLIINGARQVGKTWLIKEFGRLNYKQVAYINMDNNAVMTQLFEGDYNIERIVLGLELEAGVSIREQETLIVFDEIQEIPKALTSLKYFCENAPEYHVVSAGSLLGIALHKNASFPVGKVETLSLFPLSFDEFVRARANIELANTLNSSDYRMAEVFKSKIIPLLKDYYFVGGMPEAVKTFIENSDYSRARTVQQRIVADYERDFSK
ncbi:MAG: AAA family ATPase, partial [Gordonibacter sp.]|uniref:ATP-binding protein n=1 Tax=Gordonibacter sp. TaxID=1968902 RepID=UPI002FC74A23